MIFFKKILGLVLGLGAVVGLSSHLAAQEPVIADPNAQVDYSGKLTIMTKFGIERLSPFFVAMAEKYQALHPDVTIELIQEGDDSVKGKTKALVASNSLPDIYFSWTGNWGADFVRGNLAVDLSALLNPQAEWGKQLAFAAVEAFQYEGKFYGIPLYLDAKFMGYNKTLFEKAGVQPPEDFEALIDACSALRAADILPISFGNREGWPAVHYAGQLLAYNVSRETLERDFAPSTAIYDDPGYVTSLQQFKQLIDECTDGGRTNGSSYVSAMAQFSNARSAMYYQEIIEFDQSTTEGILDRDAFSFFKLPASKQAKGDINAIEGAPEGYMISTSSANIPLAIDFMQFVTAPENGLILSNEPYSQPSATIGGYSEETMNASVVGGLKVIASSSYLMPWLDTANTPRVAQAWLSSLQALVGGQMTPVEVMEAVKAAAAADGAR